MYWLQFSVSLAERNGGGSYLHISVKYGWFLFKLIDCPRGTIP
jgi:hypothetical protein